MYWQIFLTAWLLFQSVTGTVKTIRCLRLQGKHENLVIAGAVGYILKILLIFVCLYMGGYYSLWVGE